MGDSLAPRIEPRSWRRLVTAGVASAALAVAAPVTAQAQDLGYSGSISTARTDVPGATYGGLYFFNSIDVGRGPVRVTMSVPWIRLHTATDAAVSPTDGTTIPATDATTAGFGDPLARVDVRVVDRPASALQVGVAGAAKFPVVAAETGRGTGELDAAVGITAYKGLGRSSLMLDALYWKYGDPEGVDFPDAFSYSLAVGRILDRAGRWSTMVSLAGFSAGYDGLSPPVLLNVAMLRLLGRQSLSVSASVGLTDSATDFAIGTTWRITR